jgi:CDP-2,3-bis-(O-geranylgeranyl)-sn-glycerol synthase
MASMSDLLHTVLLAIWFFLPAGAANAAPIFMAKLPIVSRLNAPLDFGLHIGGERILGTHKTWRGLMTGVLVAALVFWLQQRAVQENTAIYSLVNANWIYTFLPLWLLGPLLGFGALAGDAAKSFFKRRNRIPAGKSWFPYDQVDYIIGAALFSALVIVPPLAVYEAALLLWGSVHVISTYVGYWLGLKDSPI